MKTPGCLACIGGRCVVHEGGGGTPCKTCSGTGTLQQVNEALGKHVRAMCPICAGTGLADKKRGVTRTPPVPVSQRDLIRLMDDE